MAAAIGTATIDFGAAPGSNEATINVTGQTTISVTSKADAFVMGDDTSSDHSANDHRYFPALCALTCGTPIAADGFPIYARSTHKLTGSYTVRWVWSD